MEQGDTDRLTAASRNAALAVAKANVTAQVAAVNRLQELTGFEQIKAPFDGVVTARNVNVGDLLNAGGTSGRALYQVADIHRMRIFVNVPQAFLGDLKPGVKATLHLPGQQETFEAELSSTANALEENSRTALIELQANNPDGKLWPGAFTEVQFHIPADPSTLRIPSTALIFGTNGMRVAAVDANNKVVLKTVRLGRDLGNRVEIQSGLSLTDRLIDNPQEIDRSGRYCSCRWLRREKTNGRRRRTMNRPSHLRRAGWIADRAQILATSKHHCRLGCRRICARVIGGGELKSRSTFARS